VTNKKCDGTFKKLISIITPIYNEEKNIEYYYSRMCPVLDKLKDKYNFEFVFTDNCSQDNSFFILEKLAQIDSRIRVFRFSKNFGYQKSIYTGYMHSKGAAAIELDCDLQDPPELLGDFLEKWEAGNKIVYGVRKHRKEGKIITFFRKLFYRTLNIISEHDIPLDAGDFMLLDREIVDLLGKINDNNIYIRGSIFSFGFKRHGIEYSRELRKFEESKFSFLKLVKLGLDGIISQSKFPLKLATLIGAMMALGSGVAILIYLFLWMFSSSSLPDGFTTIVILLLFCIGMNSIFIGVLGEYISRIYSQVVGQPYIIIERSINHSDHTDL
jgi:polyisoprenyl-phosphate glycosyltransferase